MENREVERRLAFAKAIALKAGDFLLSHEELSGKVEEKASNDFVTVADKKVEKLIYDEVRANFPLDGWYGEESGKSGDSLRRWVVDPIDGTVDYMCSFPNYTVSIAFEDEDGYALGVVYVPRQKELFWAIRNGGAFLGDKPIHTIEENDYSRTLALLVPPHRRHHLMAEYMERMVKFYSVFTDARSIGSAACSLCYVASGRCASYYEMGLNPYDYAAGALIVREAGGKVRLKECGENGVEVVATSSNIYDKVLEIVDEESDSL